MDRNQSTVLDFQYPWATDLPQQTRKLEYLLKAENLIHEVGGQTRKVGGAAKINSTVITGGPDVTGMFDFWLTGTAGTFTQKFVVTTGNSKIYKEDMDGIFDDITGAATITANAIPVFCVARDLLLIFNSANDTPLKWSQTGNVATLGGTPPAGRGAVFHNNRVWIFGANANPSRLTYGSSTSVEDYTSADTGLIDIEPDDGDRIIGAVPYKSRLIVFKGPNIGSIHIISGTAPTGADAYSRDVMVRGLALQTHNSIVPFGDDVMFMSQYGVHSLAATDKFGSFSEAFATRFLRSFFRDQITRTALNKVWGVNYNMKSCLIWTMQSASGSEPDMAFGLNYVKYTEKGFLPFSWTRGALSAAIRIHPTTKITELVFGGTDGFARRQDTSARNIDDTTAYTMRIQTPQILVGGPRPDQPVIVRRAYLKSIAAGNYDIDATITRDAEPAESYTFNQGISGFTLGTSRLDVGALGGEATQIKYADPFPFGEARALQIEITQGGLNEDANLLEMCIEWSPTGQSNESDLAA